MFLFITNLEIKITVSSQIKWFFPASIQTIYQSVKFHLWTCVHKTSSKTLRFFSLIYKCDAIKFNKQTVVKCQTVQTIPWSTMTTDANTSKIYTHHLRVKALRTRLYTQRQTCRQLRHMANNKLAWSSTDQVSAELLSLYHHQHYHCWTTAQQYIRRTSSVH